MKTFLLRLPQELAIKLKEEATSASLSMNQYIVERLENSDIIAVMKEEKGLVEPIAHDIICQLCHKPKECRTTWEDGEKYFVCQACVFTKYGKLGPSLWKKMANN